MSKGTDGRSVIREGGYCKVFNNVYQSRLSFILIRKLASVIALEMSTSATASQGIFFIY